MSTILKQSLKKIIIDSIYNDISTKRARYYHWLGKSGDWNREGVQEFLPVSSNDTPITLQYNKYYDQAFRSETELYKYIDPADICYVVKRIDWEINTVYDTYDDLITEPISEAKIWYSGMIVYDLDSTRDQNKVYVGDIIKYLGPGTNTETMYYIAQNAGNAGATPPTHFTGGQLYNEVYFTYYTKDFTLESGATSLVDAKFYVMNNLNQVYKCIWNANGAPSTEPPSGNSTDLLYTSDGYIWKYMYKIPTAMSNRFLTSEWMPVYNTLTSQYYNQGVIDNITIDDPGWNYNGVAEAIVIGDGIGADVTPVIQYDNSHGYISDMTINDGGSGYANASITVLNTVINCNKDSGAPYGSRIGKASYAAYGSNDTDTIYMIMDGRDYIIWTLGLTDWVDLGAIEVPATELVVNEAYIIFDAGNMTDPADWTAIGARDYNDVGYNTNINTTIVGHKFIASGQAPAGSTGKCYRSWFTPLKLESSTNGSRGSVVPRVWYNQSSTFNVPDPNYEYDAYEIDYSSFLIDSSSFSSGAFTANFTIGDIENDQTNIQLLAKPGAVEAFKVINGGSGYSLTDTVIVNGDGQNVPTVELKIDGSSIQEIVVKESSANNSEGYTYTKTSISSTTGSGAIIKAIISPTDGHGADAIKELYSNTIMFYSSFKKPIVNSVTLNNNFRLSGLIKNIKTYNASTSITAPFYTKQFGTNLYTIKVESGGEQINPIDIAEGNYKVFHKDMMIYKYNNSSISKYRIVDLNTTSITIVSMMGNNPISVGDAFNIAYAGNENDESLVSYPLDGVKSFTVTEVFSPDVNPYSGELLVVNAAELYTYDILEKISLRTIING